MKQLITILIILLISLTLVAQKSLYCPSPQYTPLNTPPMSAKVIGIFIGSVFLDAIGDGLNDDGFKGWGHALNAASTGLLLVSPFILDIKLRDIGWYFASYLFIRMAVFDPMYNLTRDLGIDYIGNTSLWDKAWQRLNPPTNTKMIFHGLSFSVGIAIPIRHLK